MKLIIKNNKIRALLLFILIPSLAYLLAPPLKATQAQTTDQASWYMAGANPQRTSWVAEQINGSFNVDWYRPIEAYITQKTQLVAGGSCNAGKGNIYVSTARGVYALHPDTGDTSWRFDTELPIGHSPTVINDVVYFAGFDKKVHAVDACTGQQKWEFTGAKAGYSTNPLVINNMVYLGSRDGYFYALNATTGSLSWQYPSAGSTPLGPILYSAASDGSTIYFASNDMFGYALNASNGSLVWKTPKMPGLAFHSFWPVINGNEIYFTTGSGYRQSQRPGTLSVSYNGTRYGDYVGEGMQRAEIWPVLNGSTVGPVTTSNGSQGWPTGVTIMDASKISTHLQNKPWRKTIIVINKTNGIEGGIAPVMFMGTRNGSAYPPVVMADGTAFSNNFYQEAGISQGKVTGWKTNNSFVRLMGGQGAVDEPQANSFSGNRLFTSICCDRVATGAWDYNNLLEQKAPGYDDMWSGIEPGFPRLVGQYGGINDSKNGQYHNHGDQNPMIPYKGRVYIHRSNGIIALTPQQTTAKRKPLLTINPVSDSVVFPGKNELKARLEKQIESIIRAPGFLRPGYHNGGKLGDKWLADYFENPGDNLYAIAIAYPHLSPALQTEARTYMKSYYDYYFKATMYATVGWRDNTRPMAKREYADMPKDVEDDIAQSAWAPNQDRGYPEKSTWIHWEVSWTYPPFSIYGLSKYAALFPADVPDIYNKTKAEIQNLLGRSGQLNATCIVTNAWEGNAYIAGYYGFIKIQDLAGKATVDSTLRTQVQNELNRLLTLRASTFTHTSPYAGSSPPACDKIGGGGWIHGRKINAARNFIWFSPDLGAYLNQNALAKVQAAINEYNYVVPYWMATNQEDTFEEGVHSTLYDVMIFQANAHVLKKSAEQLYKYLDTPHFMRGDLFYIQNLVATIEAPSSGTEPTPTPTSNQPTPTSSVPQQPCSKAGDTKRNNICDNVVNILDYSYVSSKFGTNDPGADLKPDGIINVLDYTILSNNFGT